MSSVYYRTDTGYESKSASAQLALIDWFIYTFPDKPCYHFASVEDLFCIQINAGIERQFNLTPNLPLAPDLEQQCKLYLHWLMEHGDIVMLIFD